MTSHSRSLFRATNSLAIVAGLLASIVVFAVGTSPSASAQDCPAGQILTVDGRCELDVGQGGGVANNPCPAGQQPDDIGLSCVPIPVDDSTSCPQGQVWYEAGAVCITDDDPCPDGQELDEAGLFCVEAGDSADLQNTCPGGHSLGADGVTCVADAPRCAGDEIVGDNGECVKSFQCEPGFVLSSDLLRCMSDGCPDGQLLSIDAKRCLAPDTDCPDGSPRPVNGSCLVVETIEGEDGPEVVVRCNDNDAFCQARVKECAETRAAGEGDGTEGASATDCEDPRSACEPGDDDCAAANDRLVECATRPSDAEGDDGGGRSIDPCDDLCPPLHRLDPTGECIEYLDPRHPCVSFGRVPEGVDTNRELDGYSYLAGTGQCVTKAEFLRRLGNFEAAAEAEADALTLLRETTSQYLGVEQRIVELENALDVANQEIVDYRNAAAKADAEHTQNQKDLHEARKALHREMLILEAEVLEVYVTGGPNAAKRAAILAASDLNEIGLIQSYSRALLDDQIDNIDRISNLETQTDAIGRDLQRAATELRSSLESATVTSAEIELLLAESERLRVEQLARRDQEATLVSQLREEKGEVAQQLGIFDQASREMADIIAQSEFEVTVFEGGDALLAKPVLPAIVVSGFGPRLHPILGYVRSHNGLDFDGNFGDSIYASAPGIVQISSPFGGYGETVVVDHGEGLLTLYAHMSVRGVDAGDAVERGDIIGFVGSTGLSTGPHLHYEVWIEGRTAVDPMIYLTDLD